MGRRHREQLLSIFQSALAAVNGRTRVRFWLEQHPQQGPVYLLAVGKAAVAMAQGAHDALGDRIADALVITKHGHAEPLPWPVWEAGHPMLDESSLAAGRRVLDFAERLPRDATVLVLVSGGASALMEVLPQTVSFEQFQRINRWVLASGLDIHDINRIRRRLSLLKGGRLAQRLAPRPILCLAISDVPGNDPRAIGSGPLSPDAELSQAFTRADMPDFVTAALRHAPEAPAPDDACFQWVRYEIIANLEHAKVAAAQAGSAAGYRVVLESEFVSGDATAAGTHQAQRLLAAAAPVLHVWGGETTMTLPDNPGRGGRNQSLALSAALRLQGREGVWLLSAGTDGTDGPTEDAGALVDGGTVARGESAGYNAADALRRADAGTFLEASGDLIQTGPTGTNVMDVMLGLSVPGGGS